MCKTTPESNLLSGLRQLPGYCGQIAHIEQIAATIAKRGELRDRLPALLQTYLDSRRIGLWSHQAATIENVRSGNNVILGTATASGKSLAFNLSVLERLILDPQATALYLYPMKALANDQQIALEELDKELELRLNIATYDGDTPSGKRSQIRARSRVILTNPHALHEYLPNHHLWERFFSHLAVVVIDEAHWYRGVLGANVAMVLRRLRRITDHYGASPQFILASGTIANPTEHAEALVGLPHEVVRNDGAPHGPKEFVLWNPVVNQNRSPHQQASDLLAYFASNHHQAICFTVSRAMAELVARWAQEEMVGHGQILSYRAGYTPQERRYLEAELRQGHIQGIATTNALELGINIGHLDSVVMAGYPGTICSLWQQAGRSGRELEPSVAVLVAFEDPLDQYLVSHPDELFGSPHEQAVVDLTNPHILSGHLLCAAGELPLATNETHYFGSLYPHITKALEAEGLLARSGVGSIFHGTFRPESVVSLSAVDKDAIQIRFEGRVLEIVSGRQKFMSAHEGAILLHRGESYRIVKLDLEQHAADAVREPTNTYTEVLSRRHIEILEETDRRQLGEAVLCFGNVQITEEFYGYNLLDRGEVIGAFPLELPKLEMDTESMWIQLPPWMGERIRSQGRDYAGGLHAAEHGLIHMMPLRTMCDRGDVGGMSTPWHDNTLGSVMFIYDGYPGGIGISRKAYEEFEALSEITYGLVNDCLCETGCPSCVYDRNCGNSNYPMDRVAASSILAWVND